MTWHPTDEDLILRLYGELAAADAQRVDIHLETCAACQAAWGDLKETQKLIDEAAVPEPEAHFERMMWARVSQALPAAPRPPAADWLRWLVPVGGVAVLVAGVIAGRYAMQDDRSPEPPPGAAERPADAARSREGVLLAALDGHFEQAELLLVELKNTTEAGPEDLEFARMAAGDLVTSGRLYRMTAEEDGFPRLAQMLDDLEPVLVEVARSPAQVNWNELRSLRARIDEEALLFKVRAVTNEIRERQLDRQ
jgi:hypothetical protein